MRSFFMVGMQVVLPLRLVGCRSWVVLSLPEVVRKPVVSLRHRVGVASGIFGVAVGI